VRDDRGSASTSSSHSGDDDIMDAVGQLSLNEDEEVRYHGKASGLYLLGGKERDDSRNEGGIWSVSPSCLILYRPLLSSQSQALPACSGLATSADR
jgi:hypothetical protein